MRTLPALGPSSPSRKWPTEEGYGGGTRGGGVETGHLSPPRQPGQTFVSTSPMKPGAGNTRIGPAGNASAGAVTSTLPPLMKGSRFSVLSQNVPAPGKGGDGGFAPSCGPPGGESQATKREDEGGRWRDKQQAWVEREQGGGDGGREGNGEEVFPFLAEDEMVLPDDRFEVSWQSKKRSTVYSIFSCWLLLELIISDFDSGPTKRFYCLTWSRQYCLDAIVAFLRLGFPIQDPVYLRVPLTA